MVAGLLITVYLVNTSFSGERKELLIVTTTSVRDSGVFDYLLEDFTGKTGINVFYIPAGSGQALEYGKRGDADGLLVHAPEDEARFVRDGYGTKRYPFMYNGFALVGPPEDPAGVSRAGSPAEALGNIRENRSVFVTRGDESGTHLKEKRLWEKAGFNYTRDINTRDNQWYLNASSGMGNTLLIADEMYGYTLCDEATYYSYASRLHIIILLKDHPDLINQYSIIPVNPAIHPHVKYQLTMELVCYLISEEGQDRISAYEVNGHKLFTPNASERC